jgi:hypothetical protein
VIGTGAHGGLPIMGELQGEARKRHVELVTLPTPEAIRVLNESAKSTNAVLHVTC